MSARELRARGGRALLACLSLVIGIIAVIFVQATAGVARAELIHLAELREGRDGSAAVAVSGDALGSQTSRLLASKSNAGADVALFVSDSGAVLTSGPSAIPIIAFEGDVMAVRPFDLIAGQWPAATTAGAAIIVNKVAWEQIAGRSGLVWRTGKGDLARHTPVTAVIDDGEQDPRAYLPWRELAAHAQPVAESSVRVLARVPSGDAAQSVEWLRWHATVDQLPIQGTIEPVNAAAGVDDQLRVVTAAFLGVGLIMLLVGVLGVLNIGLATLKERADELALRRSLGATKGDIMVLVLAESVLIGCVGSLAAVLLAVAMYRPLVAAALSGSTDVPFPLSAAVYGVVVGALAGAAGGLIPALRAARTPIAAVMRA
ncbi:ABC transporter permease [Micromonospora sp. NPDC020750]|uniref:ABC transporter permease n=1 Tax=unclassified Micromonospora TaxID=2617518 RepID=UPI0037A64C56